jgi:galactose oxidase
MRKDSVHRWRTPQGIFSLVLAASIFVTQTVALTLSYEPPPADVLAAEGVTTNSTTVPDGFTNFAASVNGASISRTGWQITVDSEQAGNGRYNVMDGNPNTFWHSEYSPIKVALPHTITIDMKKSYNVDGLTYLPRQDGNSNGNIGQHQISTSTDGVNFVIVAFGTFYDDATTKTASWETLPARYVRIHAITEAGNRGPWTSAAEINVYQASSYSPPPKGLGKWGPTINFPIVPVSASLEQHTWSVLTWSSYNDATFTGDSGGQTWTATYNPYTQSVSDRLVVNTQHDMFCPGLSLDFNGRSVVTGGNNAQKTSIYDPSADVWIAAPNMKIPRGYQASCTISDGRIFTIGGSWSGGNGGKNGEIYNPATNAWSLLPGCLVAPMLTNDAQGVYRADNHGWLFGWKDGCVFQAGPSSAMNWYCTAGSGSQVGAGKRGTDPDSMCGNAVMYDAVNGKILTLGGSPNYQGSTSTSNAHIITIGTPDEMPSVEAFSGMWYRRIFANAVVLPDGKVFITGGQTIGIPFSDANAILTPEMWDPTTRAFVRMLPNSIPRTYHSWALLMLDGTVMSGGGGLCGTCSTNHFDAQIYTPQYLLNANGSPATRPVITSMSSNTVVLGGSITVGLNEAITSMSMIRYGSATHTVDTDQRRIALTITNAGGNRYTFKVPTDPGVALPGYWMVFAMNSAGVPCVAQTIQVKP